MVRLHLFHLMVVSATAMTFFFADMAFGGCCRGPRPDIEPSQQEQQNTDETSGEEQPKQGRLQQAIPTQQWASVCTTPSHSSSDSQPKMCTEPTHL